VRRFLLLAVAIAGAATLALAFVVPAAGDEGGVGIQAAGDDEDTPALILQVAVSATGAVPPSPTFTIDVACGAATQQLTFIGTGTQSPSLTPVGLCAISVPAGGDAGATSFTIATPVVTVVNPLLTVITLGVTFDFASQSSPSPLTMSITPPSGPPGTAITIQSLEPCPPGVDVSVTVALLDATSTLASTVLHLGPDGGNWQTTLTVPAGTPVQSLEVDATCHDGAETTAAAVSGIYDVETFSVTPTQTPPGGGTSAPPVSATPNGTTPAATPAGAVTSAPTFTG